MNDRISVAIDGPSGAGKSTIARSIAGRFGFLYVDTGAIYRTVGLAVARRELSPREKDAVLSLLPQIHVRLAHGEDGLQHMYLDGEDVSGQIRTPEISMFASAVSAYPEVRAYLIEMQRTMARENDVIMDGRDIGPVVLPDAKLKISLTASPEARARRRYDELLGRGQNVVYEDVLRELKERDQNDSSRAAAPLKAAEDAIRLDTTALGFDESCEAVAKLVRERFAL